MDRGWHITDAAWHKYILLCLFSIGHQVGSWPWHCVIGMGPVHAFYTHTFCNPQHRWFVKTEMCCVSGDHCGLK